MRNLVPAAIVCASIIGIAGTQPRLASTTKSVRLRDDVTLIPGPKEVKALSVGYTAATVDLTWTRLLLEYGRHWSEKRYFRDAPRFLDVIIELEPTFAAAYLYADTFLTYQPTPDNHSTGDRNDAIRARLYLERGTRERPYDHALWLHYGQYLAFRGNSYFPTDSPEWDAWRKDGSLAILRAMELGARMDFGLAAASILGRSGEREAAVRYYERAYALAETPEQRADLGARLAALKQSARVRPSASATAS